jgi:hypothetical protein
MTAVRTLVVTGSRNTKTGGCAVTYRTAASCPSTCPLMAAGCYARGRIFGIPSRLGEEADGSSYAAVRDLAGSPADPPVRANVCGDMLTAEGAPDRPYLSALSHVAASGRAVFSYTHAWRTLSPQDAPGVCLNASCDTAADLEAAIAAGWPTVVTDTGEADGLIGSTVAGRRVVQCPAQVREGITCASCRLCARPRRSCTVAFVVHGSGRALATRSIRQHREVAS